jgi:bla regulator protein BlaR1
MTLGPWFSAAGVHILQSTLFAVAIWLLLLTNFSNATASIRYRLWFAASVKFLVPFSLLAAAGRQIVWLHRLPPGLHQRVNVTVDQMWSRMAGPIATSRLAEMPSAPFSPLPWLAGLWVAGVVVVLARWWIEWLNIRAAVRASILLPVAGGIRVRAVPSNAPRRREPGVFGIIRPVVLVPGDIQERLTPEQFESVLAHEQCHADRRDNLTATVHIVVEALCWFHPLVWWLGGRLREERERACDEAVVSRGIDSGVYAEGLLGVCRYYLESPVLSVAGVTGGNLTQRIERIMADRVARPLSAPRRMLLHALSLALVLGPFLFGLFGAPVNAQMAAGFTMQTSVGRTFEVASVKPNNSGDSGWSISPPQRGTETVRNLELRKIIASSFRIQDKMVVGGPGWLDTARYDITAKGAPDVPNLVVWEMMRGLLVERFHLKSHIEERELPVYALSIARGGSKLGDPAAGPCGEAIKAGRDCGNIRFPPFGVAIDNMPIGALTAVLARRLQDRPVVDDTGLTAFYDATVRWRPDEMTPEELATIPADVRPPDMSLFEAFERQAGLKLEARRRPIRVVIVDSVQPADPD